METIFQGNYVITSNYRKKFCSQVIIERTSVLELQVHISSNETFSLLTNNTTIHD